LNLVAKVSLENILRLMSAIFIMQEKVTQKVTEFSHVGKISRSIVSPFCPLELVAVVVEVMVVMILEMIILQWYVNGCTIYCFDPSGGWFLTSKVISRVGFH